MDSKSIKKVIATVWNEGASEYDNSYAHGIKSLEEKEEWKKLLSNVIGLDKAKILDVGAGTGFLSILLGELGYTCKGIDLSIGMLKEAIRKAKEASLTNVKFEIGDAEEIKEKDNSFDVVINRHLLWTLPNPKKAINEWIRVTKKGGKVVIIDGDWFYDSKINKFKIFLGKSLTMLTQFKNPFKHSGSYDKELIAKLPMMHDENARKIDELIKETGLAMKIFSAKEVEKAEQKAMPLSEKLKNPYKRKVIVIYK
ncbi:MAG: class I SAM-dependent methyltransferase [Sarcina sp.]